jgi:hypothetical protein
LLRVQLREVRKRISKLSGKDPAEAARAIFFTLGILEDFIQKQGSIADDAKVWQEGLTAAFQTLDSTQRWRPLYEAADEATDALLASWQGNQELSYDEYETALPLMKLTRLLALWCKSYPNLALLPLAQGLGEALESELDPQALDPWIKKARRALKKNKDPEVAELIDRIEQSQRASFSLSDILNFFSNSFEY